MLEVFAVVVLGAAPLSAFNPPFLAYGPNLAKAETTDEKGFVISSCFDVPKKFFFTKSFLSNKTNSRSSHESCLERKYLLKVKVL